MTDVFPQNSRHAPSFGSAVRKALPTLRHKALLVLGVVLIWLVLSHSFATYFSDSKPHLTLLLNGRYPAARLGLAQTQIDALAETREESSTPPPPPVEQLKTLRDEVEAIIVTAPLDAHAYRMMGQLADLQGAPKSAEPLMREAARQSLHESFAILWLMRKSFEEKNYVAAAYYADVLLRSGAVDPKLVVPTLVRMAEDKGDGAIEIKKVIARNPSWRQSFFNEMYKYVTDVRTPLDLFLSIKDTKTPATTDDINLYQWALFDKKLYELSYYTWLQFLSPEDLQAAGFLFNGNFEKKPSGSPFDWVVPDDEHTNVAISLAAKAKSGLFHALLVEFPNGRTKFPGVSQNVMLPPGNYTFGGLFKGSLSGPRGVQWLVSCADGKDIGASDMFLGAFDDWDSFKFSFSVPETGCVAQKLVLKVASRSASEQLISGEIWFDKLAIAKDESADADQDSNSRPLNPQ